METTKKFNCSQDSLVRTVILIWGYCKSRITRMAAYKSLYTNALCDAQILAANNILLMPNNDARQTVHEVIRINLSAKAKECMNLWQDFKGYARSAYGNSGDLLNAMLTSAGWKYYTDASTKWSATQGLNSSCLLFINTNMSTLTTAGYMPDDFVARITTASAEFDALYNSFVMAEQEAQEGTEARLEACNSLYETCISMAMDGQNVFRNDGVIKDEFVFSAVLAMVEPSGPAGLKGYATYIINGEPVVGLTAEIETINKQTVVNNDGFYDFGPLTGGATYTVKYKLGEEVKDTEEITIPVGTTVHKNVEIE